MISGVVDAWRLTEVGRNRNLFCSRLDALDVDRPAVRNTRRIDEIYSGLDKILVFSQ